MPTTLARVRRWLEPIALGAALWGLLAFSAGQRRADVDLANLRLSRRYWEDLTAATVNYQRGAGFLYRGAAWDWWSARIRDKLKDNLPDAARSVELKGWQFWRTVPCRYFTNAEPMRLRDSDDPGRTWLTAWGFHALGGVAPYLPLWIGVLTALPLFVWLSLECRLAGCSWVAGGTLASFALSSYAAELLTLPYSAVGFHLLGLLLVVTLAVHALRHPHPSWRGLIGRWLLGGVFFAACTLCRGTCRSFLPALLLTAIAVSVRCSGARRHRAWRMAGGVLLATTLLIGPYWLVRPAQRHEIWVALWEGLGDFDREKGHAWYDPTAREVLRRQGAIIPEPIEPAFAPEQEAMMRRLLLREVASDPLWYAKILAQRVPATLLELRLWPRASVDGTSYAKSTHPNEGITNAYYSLAPTADSFGVGRWTWEAPLPLLWLPFLVVLGGAAFEGWAGRPLRLFPVAGIAALAVVALAAAAMPLAFTTAAGPETQAFVIVYFFALGLTLDAVQRALSGAREAACHDPGK